MFLIEVKFNLRTILVNMKMNLYLNVFMGEHELLAKRVYGLIDRADCNKTSTTMYSNIVFLTPYSHFILPYNSIR